MQLQDILGARCLVELSYYDHNGRQIKQSQLAGQVVKVSTEDGISLKLQNSAVFADATDEKPSVLVLPPTLSCWFLAPSGHYRDPVTRADIHDPDFLVSWDIHQTELASELGEHEWWEWVPGTKPPRPAKSPLR